MPCPRPRSVIIPHQGPRRRSALAPRTGNLSTYLQTADPSYSRSYAAWREYIRLALAVQHGESVHQATFERLDAETDPFATAQA